MAAIHGNHKSPGISDHTPWAHHLQSFKSGFCCLANGESSSGWDCLTWFKKQSEGERLILLKASLLLVEYRGFGLQFPSAGGGSCSPEPLKDTRSRGTLPFHFIKLRDIAVELSKQSTSDAILVRAAVARCCCLVV